MEFRLDMIQVRNFPWSYSVIVEFFYGHCRNGLCWVLVRAYAQEIGGVNPLTVDWCGLLLQGIAPCYPMGLVQAWAGCA